MIVVSAQKWAGGELKRQVASSGSGTSVPPASWLELPCVYRPDLRKRPFPGRSVPAGVNALVWLQMFLLFQPHQRVPLDRDPGIMSKAPSGELGILRAALSRS